jgi:hypothetical protein
MATKPTIDQLFINLLNKQKERNISNTKRIKIYIRRPLTQQIHLMMISAFC